VFGIGRTKPENLWAKPTSIFYTIQVEWQMREEGIGWASEGWNAKKASLVLSELKKNHLTERALRPSPKSETLRTSERT